MKKLNHKNIALYPIVKYGKYGESYMNTNRANTNEEILRRVNEIINENRRNGPARTFKLPTQTLKERRKRLLGHSEPARDSLRLGAPRRLLGHSDRCAACPEVQKDS